MGKKRIKHLGKKSKRRKIQRLVHISIIVILIIILCLGVKYLKSMFVSRDIEDTKIEFYINIADEIGKDEVQLNWKELLAIDMFVYNNDLSNVKKSDVIHRGKKFIETYKDKNGNTAYYVKDFNEALNDLGMKKSDKVKINNYLSQLENVYLGNRRLNKDSLQIKFISKIKDRAIINYEQFGILPSITIAQCILESGWGNSELSTKGKNLFGIKADSSWEGQSMKLETSENYDNKSVAEFRVYSSINDSIKDHGEFLSNNPRYRKNGLFDGKTYILQAQSLEDAGYSTKEDENGNKIYADMLINLIREYNLQLIDWSLYKKK